MNKDQHNKTVNELCNGARLYLHFQSRSEAAEWVNSLHSYSSDSASDQRIDFGISSLAKKNIDFKPFGRKLLTIKIVQISGIYHQNQISP